MLKRRFAVMAAVALLTQACAGATQSPSAPASSSPTSATTPGPTGTASLTPITLQFPTWQITEQADFFTKLVAAYQQQYPNVTLNMTYDPFAGHEDNLVKALSAGQPPDVVHMQAPDVQAFAQKGWLENLDPYFAKTDILQNWTPLEDSLTYNGNHYAFLLSGFPWVMYYNTQLLSQKGLSVPMTPQELVSDISAFQGSSNGVYGLIASTSSADSDTFDQLSLWLTGNNASWVANGKPDATDPAVASAVDLYRQAIKNAPAGLDVFKARTLFEDGKGAFYLDGSFYWSLNQANAPAANKSLFQVAPLPFPVVPTSASNALAIPASLPQANKDAVFNLIKLWASPAIQALYAEDFGSPPPRIGVPTPYDQLASPIFQLTPKLAALKTDSLVPADPSVHLNFGQFQQILQNVAVELQTSSTPTSDILAKLQTDLTSALSQ